MEKVEKPEEQHQHLSDVVCALVCVSVSSHLTHGRGKQIALTGPLTSYDMICTFDRVSRESWASERPVRLESIMVVFAP